VLTAAYVSITRPVSITKYHSNVVFKTAAMRALQRYKISEAESDARPYLRRNIIYRDTRKRENVCNKIVCTRVKHIIYNGSCRILSHRQVLYIYIYVCICVCVCVHSNHRVTLLYFA